MGTPQVFTLILFISIPKLVELKKIVLPKTKKSTPKSAF